MKNKQKIMSSNKMAESSSFSDFFQPQNQANVKEALREVTMKANTEQKAVIMGFRSSTGPQYC